MKKLLTSLTALLTISSSISAVISCKAPQIAEGVLGQKVIVVTDAGNIRDQSFNESAWDAVIKYGINISKTFGFDNENNEKMAREFDYKSSVGNNKWEKGSDGKYSFGDPNFEDARNHNFNFVETADHSYDAFRISYNTAIYKGADAMLLAGFGHLNTIPYAAKRMKNRTVVLIDAKYEAKNVISVVFKSELAGFNAGWDALLWANLPKLKDNKSYVFSDATLKASQNNSNQDIPLQGSVAGNKYISIGMFGGLSNKNAVNNYMWGVLAAMTLYNKVLANKQVTLEDANKKQVTYTLKPVHFANVAGDLSKMTQSPNPVDWFTNSFDIGGATKSGLISKLVDNKADIIFPVAGPQINDVLQFKADYKPYVIGVDTDQVTNVGKSSPGWDTRFITSAQKNIVDASVYALQRASSLKHATINGKTYESTNKEKSDGQTLWGKEPNWSISSSRSANETWGQKDKANSYNLAIKSVDYTKTVAKDIDQILPKVLAGTGSALSDYLNKSVLDKAVDEILSKYPDNNQQPTNAKNWQSFTYKDDGIASIQNYWKMLKEHKEDVGI